MESSLIQKFSWEQTCPINEASLYIRRSKFVMSLNIEMYFNSKEPTAT